jgi:hypothetical protein
MGPKPFFYIGGVRYLQNLGSLKVLVQQKIQQPKYLLLVKGLEICFYLGWSGRTDIIKVVSK